MAEPKVPTPSRSTELDEVTLARARRGERAAQQILILRYQGAVFSLLGRMGVADVEDLAQETFLRVLRALPGFDPRGPARLSSWILTIATRLALDVLRRGTTDADDNVLALPSSEPSPASRLASKALGARIAVAVDALPPAYRAAFVLRGYHELSLSEIAQALECDVNTIKSRLARARSILRSTLGEERDHG